ncbi:MAG: DUF5677 domain-containing protein [Solimonas sp.]
MTDSKLLDSALSSSKWPEWQWFDSIAKLLEETLSKVQEHGSDELGALYPFLDSIVESASSLRSLINQLKLRDAYVISRVIYETAVNACFLLTNPKVLSDRASTHAKQKALRNLTRAVEVAGDKIFEVKHQSTDEILGIQHHQEWLQEFTSKSGREITSWTPENVQQRLEEVYLRFGNQQTRGLAFGLLLYRHASEIAHGTLFGTLFSWGAMEIGSPLRSPADLGVFRRKELRHLLKLVSFSLESLIRIVCSVIEMPEVSIRACRARTDYYDQRGENA